MNCIEGAMSNPERKRCKGIVRAVVGVPGFLAPLPLCEYHYKYVAPNTNSKEEDNEHRQPRKL